MHIKNSLLCIALALSYTSANAQYPKDNPEEDVIRTTNFPKMPKLLMSDIAGAPILSQPIRLDGMEQDIRTCKHGLCYPALYDWNGDGKPDLLLGEFSTGDKENNIRVYINSGSRSKPRFSGHYFYAMDAEGDTISNHQWCCIGIHPRIADIDCDGRPDLLSGQYFPGAVTLWRGHGAGHFAPMEYVPQEGFGDGNNYPTMECDSPNGSMYWNYTSASFADFNGDGLLDLFVGGTAGARVALNEGTPNNPKFGLRQYLRLTDGNILSANTKSPQREGHQPEYKKSYLYPVDWDNDGVLDILMTHEYDRPGSQAILFFRGVNTNLGLRFLKPQPLFTSVQKLPGCQPMLHIGDLNGDGINDIVMGLSIPAIGYEIQQDIASQWISDLGIQMPGKDAGEYYQYATREEMLKKIEDPSFRYYYLGKLQDTKFLDLRHRGYVFVMYGSRNKKRAVAERLTLLPPPVTETKPFDNEEKDSPLTYAISSDGEYGSYTIKIVLRFKKGWHGYSDSEATSTMGMIPTTVSVKVPEGIILNGPLSAPYTGGSNIYSGEIVFKQHIFVQKYNLSTIPIKVTINYQACDEHLCMPPTEHSVTHNIIKQ
ncbi:MAG: FG-GAP-like repeat-containing protein [Prevotella sp.]